MQYLIIPADGKPLLSNFFEHEKNYQKGMQVYDLKILKYTKDGIVWHPLEIDTL